MQVSKSLAKWAYAWNYIVDRKPYYHERIGLRWDDRKHCYPENISLCPLFWRTFAVTPAMIAAGLGLGTLVLVGIRDAILPILVFGGLFGAGIALAWGISKIIPNAWVETVKDTAYAAGSYVAPVFDGLAKAKKTMCPILGVKK